MIIVISFKLANINIFIFDFRWGLSVGKIRENIIDICLFRICVTICKCFVISVKLVNINIKTIFNEVYFGKDSRSSKNITDHCP